MHWYFYYSWILALPLSMLLNDCISSMLRADVRWLPHLIAKGLCVSVVHVLMTLQIWLRSAMRACSHISGNGYCQVSGKCSSTSLIVWCPSLKHEKGVKHMLKGISWCIFKDWFCCKSLLSSWPRCSKGILWPRNSLRLHRRPRQRYSCQTPWCTWRSLCVTSHWWREEGAKLLTIRRMQCGPQTWGRTRHRPMPDLWWLHYIPSCTCTRPIVRSQQTVAGSLSRKPSILSHLNDPFSTTFQ